MGDTIREFDRMTETHGKCRTCGKTLPLAALNKQVDGGYRCDQCIDEWRKTENINGHLHDECKPWKIGQMHDWDRKSAERDIDNINDPTISSGDVVFLADQRSGLVIYIGIEAALVKFPINGQATSMEALALADLAKTGEKAPLLLDVCGHPDMLAQGGKDLITLENKLRFDKFKAGFQAGAGKSADDVEALINSKLAVDPAQAEDLLDKVAELHPEAVLPGQKEEFDKACKTLLKVFEAAKKDYAPKEPTDVCDRCKKTFSTLKLLLGTDGGKLCEECSKLQQPYDSTEDTKAHISEVITRVKFFADCLLKQAEGHDKTKLESPEKETFDRVTPKLKGLTYGSDAYKASLKEMKVALDHHYAHTRHHPESFGGSITLMNLIDLVEMLCDWKAATLRHADGSILRSLEISAERFGIGPQLLCILKNTIIDLNWEKDNV